ncbi:hypothetical protein MVEG_12030 [Podila verticillata NRRL 6337]|uniref:Copper transport protein n=1 Tax=Podila verticillata NRRL 6337 TaxID=1069443 RepID=A0A086TL11_9FUNG|nr:MAG: Ctr copper transporter family-domain-containing protein [Podila humilis]KFH62638.1 hypothetical protein MVEG_12030 [Podila verticillata NRRL 6337]
MDHSMTAGFMSGMGTPVWSPNLTPNSEPQYIGALLGLFILSIGFRGLVAAQGYLEAYLHLHFYPHSSHIRTSVPSLSREDRPFSSGRTPFPIESSSQDQDLSPAALDSVAVHTSSSGTPADQQQQQQAPRRYRMQGSHAHAHRTPAPAYNNTIPSTSTSLFHSLPTIQPFVWQADVLRALLTTAVVGVGYMLMLVVMTYNSAYFAVILAGIFVGELYFARWGRARAVHTTKNSSSSSTSFATSYREKQGVPVEEAQASSPLSASTLQSPQAVSLRPSLAHRSPSMASSVVSSSSRSSYQPPLHNGDGAC